MKQTDEEIINLYKKRLIGKGLAMARKRGYVSAEWHKKNKLNNETISEFKALMKKTDKEFQKILEE